MSHVTDMVFILPSGYGLEADAYQQRFEESFLAAHGWEVCPQEDGGGKVMSITRYAAGVNWISHDWIEHVCAGDWPQGTVLWLESEGLMDQPSEISIHQLGPKETS